jgi:hypothetical protein
MLIAGMAIKLNSLNAARVWMSLGITILYLIAVGLISISDGTARSLFKVVFFLSIAGLTMGLLFMNTLAVRRDNSVIEVINVSWGYMTVVIFMLYFFFGLFGGKM